MSAATKHTPGPWTVQTLTEGHHGYANWNTYAVRSPANVCIAVVGEMDRYHEATYGADARLIAAAPALLEALEAMLPIVESMDDGDGEGLPTCVVAARSALSAARGNGGAR